MNLSLFEFQCQECLATFETPLLSDFQYGLFLCRTRSGVVRYVDAFDDPVFEDVRARVANLLGGGGEKDHREELQLLVFGAVCDPAPNGEEFAVAASPRCPICLSGCRQAGLEATGRTVLEPVSHARWFAASDAEKQRLIQARIMETREARGEPLP